MQTAVGTAYRRGLSSTKMDVLRWRYRTKAGNSSGCTIDCHTPNNRCHRMWQRFGIVQEAEVFRDVAAARFRGDAAIVAVADCIDVPGIETCLKKARVVKDLNLFQTSCVPSQQVGS